MESETSNSYEMHKRRDLMADNRRYIIYYTFGENSVASIRKAKSEKPAPVTETINSDTETRNTEAI